MDLHNLYSSPHVMRVVELRQMTWVGHVARMGEKVNTYRVLVGRCGGMNRVIGVDVSCVCNIVVRNASILGIHLIKTILFGAPFRVVFM